MSTLVSDDDYLALSGIQHIAFCERQWALIHVERLWEDNLRTFGGHRMHERADNPFFTESRGTILICRSVPLHSDRLKLYGVADVVEFLRDYNSERGISIDGRDGKWIPHPVEYKYGQPKEHDADIVQLCAQAICLEEMLNIDIDTGSIFYGKTRHRISVTFDDTLRKRVENLASGMHEYFSSGITPKAEKKKACESCSLKNLCMPEIVRKKQTVSRYIEHAINGGDI